MKKALLITLVVVAVLALAGVLVMGGMTMGRWFAPVTYAQQSGTGTGGNAPAYGPGMMGSYGYGYGPGMMGGGRGNGYGPGMMGGNGYGYGPGMMGGYGPGMMRGYGARTSATPLTVDQAYQSATKYLSTLNLPDLKIAEVLIFSNNAYVRVVEQSTGIGAFELLVDPVTQVAYPEPGPNMMWNLKYGGLNHQGMMGYSYGSLPADVSASMPVSSAQALQSAQTYLDSALPGDKTAADADPFYG